MLLLYVNVYFVKKTLNMRQAIML